MPLGFEAYARVLHPAQRRTDHGWEPIRWTEVAHWKGTTAHPQMHFHRVARIRWPDNPDWGSSPADGSLPAAEGERLVLILRRFTSTPDRCYLALWEGLGWSRLNALVGRPRLMLTHRNFFVFTGPIEKAPSMRVDEYRQPPNLWWPEDQAWCVSTDVDSNATYIGGSRACIERIVSDPDLEAFELAVDARIDYDGDMINPRIG